MKIDESGWRILLVLGFLALGALALGGCKEASEDVSESRDPESAASEGSDRPVEGSSSAVESPTEKAPTKLPREEDTVKDPRPAPPKYPTAVWIPGKPGFCFNPFNNNQVDIRGIPPGTLVRDPMDETPTQRFRVPKLPEEKVVPE